MKNPIKFQEIDKLDPGKYEAKFKAALKKIKQKANTPETAVEVFINQEFEFSDGTVGPLLLVGNMAGPWKKWAKDAIKANKKMTMVGKGYVETADDGSDKLTFMKLKGDAKVHKFAKEAKKLLKKVKIAALNLVDDIASATASAVSEAAEEAAAATDEAAAEEEEATPNKDAEIFPKVKELMKSIADDFKNKVRTEVVPKVKSQSATEEDLNKTSTVRDKIDKLIEAADELSDEIREKIQDKLDKITGLAPTLEKVMSKITDFLGLTEAEDEVLEDDDVDNNAPLTPEELEALPENPNEDFFNRILEQLQNGLSTNNQNLDTMEANAAAPSGPSATSPIPGGTELLNSLF